MKGVESVVEVRKGDESGVGSIHRYTWKSKLPYGRETIVRYDWKVETTKQWMNLLAPRSSFI